LLVIPVYKVVDQKENNQKNGGPRRWRGPPTKKICRMKKMLLPDACN
jgi:hypothetical protein